MPTAETPLVSIVIASHNYGRFLDEAIRSALAQTHPSIEVVVVDDGSADDSVQVAQRHPVRVIEQSNLGVAHARNRGAREARGDLLVFLDADDMLEPNFVARCWHSLKEAPPYVAYAYTPMRMFGAEQGIFQSRPFSRAAFYDGNFIPVTTLLRRAPFAAVDGFDPSLDAYEDHDLWLRLFARGWIGTFVQDPLLLYRRHGRSRNVLSRRVAQRIFVQVQARHWRVYWRRWLRHPLDGVRCAMVGARALGRRLRDRRPSEL